jgi:hypothetical protein
MCLALKAGKQVAWIMCLALKVGEQIARITCLALKRVGLPGLRAWHLNWHLNVSHLKQGKQVARITCLAFKAGTWHLKQASRSPGLRAWHWANARHLYKRLTKIRRLPGLRAWH